MTARDNITEHYGADREIARRIDEQLRLSGLTDDHTLSPSDLAALDQFHVGGLEATQELARLFSPSRRSSVLDIGSGLGGPSRYLAANYGCRVIGIEITEEYCRIASVLAARMGLEDRVEYRNGDARELLFPDGTFDGAWTQHVSMNIAEKSSCTKEYFGFSRPAGGSRCTMSSSTRRVLFYFPCLGPGRRRSVIFSQLNPCGKRSWMRDLSSLHGMTLQKVHYAFLIRWQPAAGTHRRRAWACTSFWDRIFRRW